MKRYLALFAAAFSAVFFVVLTAGCSMGTRSVSGSAILDGSAKWVLLPLENHTDTPQAGLSAEAITEHVLRLHGVANIARYPAALSRDTLFEPSERKVVDEARKWAQGQGARYGLTGSVEEWRYKVGIDGEPAVGLSLQIVDLSSDQVMWSASGADSGWSREALSGVANKLIEKLLGDLKIGGSAPPSQ